MNSFGSRFIGDTTTAVAQTLQAVLVVHPDRFVESKRDVLLYLFPATLVPILSERVTVILRLQTFWEGELNFGAVFRSAQSSQA